LALSKLGHGNASYVDISQTLSAAEEGSNLLSGVSDFRQRKYDHCEKIAKGGIVGFFNKPTVKEVVGGPF